jgi:fused signal recognition particle receptor
LGAEVIHQGPGSDPAAVVFDAVSAAKARDADVLLIDSAGRLHTKQSLMDELVKIKRVIARALPGAPHEILLVLDASTGQNGLAQARVFHEALGVTGIVVTKLDGTPKGGIVLAIVDELGLPVKLLGLGEEPDALVPFDATAFAEGLVG